MYKGRIGREEKSWWMVVIVLHLDYYRDHNRNRDRIGLEDLGWILCLDNHELGVRVGFFCTTNIDS